MAFPPEFLRELEARNPIEEVASAYVNLKRRGKNLVGLCPFHNEKTGSFNIYPGNNSFYCFGCNKGGDVISFVMGVENLDFPEAVRWLAQRAGMTVPEDGVDDSMSRLRTRILEINRETARFYYKMLSAPEGKPGLDYFRRRGLDNKTIQHFGLGYSPESGFALVNHLTAKGYIPVISSVGCDSEGNVYNINADTMAAQISGAMGAECLISMTDVPGIMLDPNDKDSLVHVADINDATDLFRQGVIKGGMIPKVESCIEALLCGVHKVFILDGRVPHSILLEMLTDEGSGTMMVGEKK